MKKIIIIGGNGSGKTTFARELSNKLNIPLIFIDKIFWTDNWQRADEKTAISILNSLLQKDLWIIDGNHLSTLKDRLDYCDTVFFFDFSAFDCMIGSVKRIVQNYGKQRDDVGGSNNIEKFDKSKIIFLKSVLHFNRNNREFIYQILHSHPSLNNVVFKNRKEVLSYLNDKKYLQCV